MGIDGIGKKGPATSSAPEPAAGSRIERPERRFEIATERPAPVAEPVAAEPPRTALERLQRHEVDFAGYLDLKVDEATRHLAGLPTAELQAIREHLRERLAQDPTLTDLVRAATGQAPEPTRDE